MSWTGVRVRCAMSRSTSVPYWLAVLPPRPKQRLRLSSTGDRDRRSCVGVRVVSPLRAPPRQAAKARASGCRANKGSQQQARGRLLAAIGALLFGLKVPPQLGVEPTEQALPAPDVASGKARGISPHTSAMWAWSFAISCQRSIAALQLL
jgi:hypothetical protein